MTILKAFRLSLVSLAATLIASACFAGSWSGLRTSGPGTTGWQPLICENGSGWRSCEMPVKIALTANPTFLVAIGEQSTITATVTDYYGVAMAGIVLNWTITDGTKSAAQTTTNAGGVTSITLTSSHNLGGSTVTAETVEKDGIGSIWVPYIDKFVAYPSTYTPWANYGAYYSCTAWSPDTSTVASGTWFTQTASCWQQQQQWRQDRLQSVVTGSIKNNGSPVPLYQAIIIGISQVNVGTKVVAPVCSFAWVGPGTNIFGPSNFLWTGKSRDDAGNNATVALVQGGYTGLSLTYNQIDAGQGVVYNGAFYTVGASRGTWYSGGMGGGGVQNNVYEYCITPL